MIRVIPETRATMAAALVLVIGMGFGRFAFTGLYPLMVSKGHLSVEGGSYAASANYAGYLAGALLIGFLPAMFSHQRVIEAIKNALDGAGIDMPFPTQVVLHHDQTEEVDGMRGRQREGWPPRKDNPQPRPLRLVETSEQGAGQSDLSELSGFSEAPMPPVPSVPPAPEVPSTSALPDREARSWRERLVGGRLGRNAEQDRPPHKG